MTDPVLDLNFGRWLPSSLDSTILDLGCGDGRILRYLSSKGYSRILGVDRDESILVSSANIPGVSLESAEVNSHYLAKRTNSFDLIIAKQMIYYIDRNHSLQFMRALKEALTENGVIIFEYFNGALVSSRFTELKDPFILTSYTEHSMRRLIYASGLYECATYGELITHRYLKSRLYSFLRSLWFLMLLAIYILERGYDRELPAIGTKSIITVATKNSCLR
jgi:2-polyprenyl-3-methyl-5-hydroxy-6-metoxy-1,4-benzoquinol methylase